MTRPLLEAVVVPVATPEDARTTARALGPYLPDVGTVVVVHVIEKAGGAPDKAGVEQREEVGDESIAAFEDAVGAGGPAVEGRLAFDTDVVDGILGAAADADATAIAFSPREGGRLVRYLSGDVSLRLVTESEVPVVSLPRGDVDA
ncbi:universal stress protein [Halorarum salinum]|uniref:Universal stress protein n=1 Tax=Halorarum salinum TaxID=2743089 RepID=A0A7D5QBF3_9EURY|nr:universal stress protein [Halobaculum salinum]QLG63316.1 universal stress protein [Halobaculum salinum]